MPANLLGDFATKNTKQSPTITAHDGKARRRRKDAPDTHDAPQVGTVVIGLRMTPAERDWIQEYAWRNRTTVGKIVRAYLRTLREQAETSSKPARQRAATR